MKNIALLMTILLSLSLLSSPVQQRPFAKQPDRQPEVSLQLSWDPQDPVNGSPLLFKVKATGRLNSLTGEWSNRRVFFDYDPANGTWYGFAGAGVDASPGRQSLVLTGKLENGTTISSTHAVTIRKTTYRRITLRVAPKYTEPDPETLARIMQEQELKKEAFKRIGAERFWSGNFTKPVNDVVTGQFGTERTFNRRRQSVHQGLDLRAAVGTPISAMNSGEVVLAHEMFYEGGFIVINHGHGLMTLYMHLSEIRVKEGDRIDKQQIIGLSGKTGRVTAPHLHVAVRWQGIYLDPKTLIEMSF